MEREEDFEREKNFRRERVKNRGGFGEKGRNKIFWGMWAHQSRDLGAQVIIAPLRIKKNEAIRGGVKLTPSPKLSASNLTPIH
jgi:hypothetical protein